MTVERISAQLLELYKNSGSDFFEEAIALIKAHMADLCHSLFSIEREDRCKVLSTNIKDADEIVFWERALQKELCTGMKTCFQIPIKRLGIQSHIIIPLFVREELCGVWILESRTQEEIRVEKVHLNIANLIALFIKDASLIRKCVQNMYLDAETELPGRAYFQKIIGRLQNHKIWLSVFRILNYREGIRMHGNTYMEEAFKGFLQQVRKIEKGNIYILSEDTVALLSNENEIESFAGAKQIMTYQIKELNIIGAFLDLSREEHIMTLLEEIFSITPAGNIWRREQNPIASLFLSEAPKEKAVEKQEDLPQELVEELLFEFLERT